MFSSTLTTDFIYPSVIDAGFNCCRTLMHATYEHMEDRLGSLDKWGQQAGSPKGPREMGFAIIWAYSSMFTSFFFGRQRMQTRHACIIYDTERIYKIRTSKCVIRNSKERKCEMSWFLFGLNQLKPPTLKRHLSAYTVEWRLGGGGCRVYNCTV